MAGHLPPTLLDRFSEFVARHYGLNFPPNRHRDLERNLLAACREFGFDQAEACLHWLYDSPLSQEQTEILTTHLTVGETYFFREKASFELLEKYILPELIAARRNTTRRLRIWSAGCATGEETYSLAILLCKLLDVPKEWNLNILGTDINVRALRKATAGTYGNWSFRNAPEWLKGTYVRAAAVGKYEVREDIRECVTFSFHNLVEDPYPSVSNNTNAMDIIVCCNVLMYFQPETIRRIARKFYDSLIDGGWLIVSPGEATPSLFPNFERIGFPSAVLFRRQGTRAYAPQPSAPGESVVPVTEPEHLPLEQTAAPAWEAVPVASCDELETVIPAPPATIEDAYDRYARGQYAEAATMLQSIAGPQADALMARLYANQGMLDEALSWCNRAIGKEKTDPRHHYLRASILQELGCDEEAMLSLKHVLFLDQDFILAHLALGNILQRQGKRQEAQRPYRIALSLLQRRPRDEIFPESEGMTAGRLREVVLAAQQEAMV